MGELDRSIRVRPATGVDRPAIFEVLATANMQHVPSPEMPEFDLVHAFVAEVDGQIPGLCGYAVLSPTEGKTTLLAVRPEFRGLGIGYALQVRRMEALLEKGVRTLTTNADRPETIAWYRKHFGYQQVGTLAKLHEFGHPDIDCWTTLRTDLRVWDAARREPSP